MFNFVSKSFTLILKVPTSEAVIGEKVNKRVGMSKVANGGQDEQERAHGSV